MDNVILNSYSKIPSLNVSRETCNELENLISMIQEKNKEINIISKKNSQKKAIRERHIVDSAQIIDIVDLNSNTTCDLGTGGGMPGMIIALCQPQRQCVLLDSNGKKIRFLKQFIADLKLSNVVAVQTRVENQNTIDELGQFDVITSRAFASLTDFVDAAQPYLHQSSIIAAMKGVVPVDEIEQLKQDFLCKVIELRVPRLDEQRHLLLLQRI